MEDPDLEQVLPSTRPSRSCRDLNHGRPYTGELLAGTKGRTPDLRSDDEGGSFAAGRARKSLSLPGRFRNTTMEKPAVTDTLQDFSGSPVWAGPARRTCC